MKRTTKTLLTLSEAIDGTVAAALPWDVDCDHSLAYVAGCDCDLCAAHAESMHHVADAHRDATLGDLEADAFDDCDDAREVECPTCQGHGDVPSGRHTRENPTGLIECPRCQGERFIPCDQRGDGPHVDYDLATIVSLRAEAV